MEKIKLVLITLLCLIGVMNANAQVVNPLPINSTTGSISGNKTWTSNSPDYLYPAVNGTSNPVTIVDNNAHDDYGIGVGENTFTSTVGAVAGVYLETHNIVSRAPLGWVITGYDFTLRTELFAPAQASFGSNTGKSNGRFSESNLNTEEFIIAVSPAGLRIARGILTFTNFKLTLKNVGCYKATANAVAGIGGYASVSENATQYATGIGEKTFYYSLSAVAKEGYKFVGWSETEGGNIISTNTNYNCSITCTPTNKDINKTWYANFEPDITQNTNTFTNPISDIDAADPSVILAQDGYYYMYCTESGAGIGMPVWRSSDMINWTKITNIFAQHPENVAYTYLWAPEIAYVNGKYVLYYANADFGNQANTQICVATSDKPYGPFENNKILLRAHDNNYGAYNANVDNVIDPSLFRDDDGKNYLVWGSFNGIYYIELDENCTSIKEGASRKDIATHETLSSFLGINEIAGLNTGVVDNILNGDWNEIEAPMIVKHKASDDNDEVYYYLIASKGSTVGTDNPDYKLVMARGKTLGGDFYDIDGDRVFHPTRNPAGITIDEFRRIFRQLTGVPMRTLLEGNNYVKGPGHCSQFVKDFNEQEWIFYHGYTVKDGNADIAAGRKVFADRILWDKWFLGWPGITPPDETPIEQPTVDPKGPETYQIYNAQDLMDFAATVNGGEVFASATLMNDIDMAGVDYTPIGTESNKFQGVIDGQGYRIKNLTINGGNNTGLVAFANGGAQFRYIIIDSSCEISGGDYTGAFLGRLDGSGVVQFYCCGNEAHVTGIKNTAGFVGCDTGVTLYFDNCYNTGRIDGDNESAAFSGWGIDRLRNCWNTGRIMGCQGAGDGKWYSLARDYNENKNVNSYDLNSENNPVAYDAAPEGYDDLWLSNGHFTYYINKKAGLNVWYQNIDETFGANKDLHPVFLTSHLPVYNDGDIYYNVRVKGEYIRNLTTANYGTLCLGYETISTVGATFYDILAVQKNDEDEYTTIVLQEVADLQHLIAGKAYIFKPNDGSKEIRCEYWDGAKKDAIIAPGLVGNLLHDNFKVPVGDYILSGNKIKKVVKNNYIDLNRAYITGFDKLHEDVYANASRLVFFGFDGDITEGETNDVEFVISDTNKNQNVLYNLAGQRISQPVRGQIYIMNGRKYIAK